MPNINVYLNFKGNTEEAFNFYKSVFGGEFCDVLRWKDMPASEGGCNSDEMGEMKLSEADHEKIMHIALPIGKTSILMGSDAIEAMLPKTVDGNNFSVSVSTDSKEQTDELFARLSEGGKPMMPPSEPFWGGYFGMLQDKFGIQWLLNYDAKQSN